MTSSYGSVLDDTTAAAMPKIPAIIKRRQVFDDDEGHDFGVDDVDGDDDADDADDFPTTLHFDQEIMRKLDAARASAREAVMRRGKGGRD